MNLYFRFMFLLLKRVFLKKPLDLFDPCETTFWVNPLDLDMNLHMNNGRYLSIMDLGRFDLMIRGGVFWTYIKKGYYPVVFSESIRFKKSLQPFQTFKMITTIESWDEKDFYISQKFKVKGEIIAEGYIRGRFKQRGRKGSVPTPEVFSVGGKSFDSSRLSDLSKAQVGVDSLLCK